MVTRPLMFIKAGYFVMGVPKPWGPRLTGHYGGNKVTGVMAIAHDFAEV